MSYLNSLSQVSNRLNRLFAFLGLDFDIVVTLLFRSWGVVAGGCTILLLPMWLTPIQQGYSFTFASILALQVFFELGLNQSVVQLVSHEVAFLRENNDGQLEGDVAHLVRLGSLARMTQKWYSVAASLFALVGGAAGLIFFSQKGSEPITTWVGIWWVLVCATAFNLWLSPGLAMMEGCGKVGKVAQLRLTQSIVGYTIFWLALIMGVGLWVVIVLPVVSTIFTWYWLRTHGKLLRWLARRSDDPRHRLLWQNDVFPLQWRIALSWAGGYFIFNLLTPTVFSNYGAIEAGKLGIALTIFSSISTICMSWINAKSPKFTMHIARNEKKQLNILFNGLFVRSTFTVFFASFGLVIVVWYLNKLEINQINRIAEPKLLAILAIITILNAIIFSMAVYMRAHRQEPMLVNTLVCAALIAIVIILGIKISIFVMMFMYMMVGMVIGLPWTIYLFLNYYKNKIK